MNNEIVTKEAPVAIGPYSQGIGAGEFCFVSGQLPTNPVTGAIESENIKDQANQALKNVEAVLKEGGFTLDDVVKTTCFIADMSLFGDFNEVYSKFFTGVCPARSCFAVKGLPKNALCEIEVIAHK